MELFALVITGWRVAGAVSPGVSTGGGGGMGIWGWLGVGLVAVGVGIVLVIGVRAQLQIARLDVEEFGGGERELEGEFASGRVLADVDELSRRLAEELDQKAERLERLIAEADAKIAALEGMKGRGTDAVVGVDPLNSQVYEMADRGCSAVEIAQRLGQHVGKVELILALRR